MEKHPYFFGFLALAALILFVYGDVIFGSSNIVLSRSGTDLTTGIYNAVFSFSQLRQGHLPLWNPHLLSGYPWFASFQTLLLYPPAWMFLVLPLGKAVNAFIVLHVLLIGFGMYCWLKQQNLHPLSCVLGGALLMFASTVTMQIYAGHVTPLSSMAWIPFILWTVDGCFNVKNRLRWILAGTIFVALQIMGGFPQHVYYTGLVVGIYVIGKIIQMSPATLWQRLKVLLSVGVIYLWACVICAIQLLTTFAAATETARQGKLPFNFAGSYSFPFENILTLFFPKILGDGTYLPYWGRWDMWEMIFYIGITGVILAFIGFRFSIKNEKQCLPFLSLIVITGLISFGKYTPFYILLYNYVPGFGSFRVNSRILFETSVFLVALSAFGYDYLLKTSFVSKQRYATGMFVMAGLFFIAAVMAFSQHLPGLKVLLAFIPSTHQHYLNAHFYTTLSNIHHVAQFASLQILMAAILTFMIGILFWMSAKTRRAIYYLGLLSIAELIFFTATMRPTFDLRDTQKPKLKEFLAAHPGDERFLKIPLDNWAASLPSSISGGDISGYESFRLMRYDRFIQYAQGDDDQTVYPILPFERLSPLFALLRCKYFFDKGKIKLLKTAPLPHLLLVPRWQRLQGQEKVLSKLSETNFNPRSIVYLESSPKFNTTQKTPNTIDTASITHSSSDWLDITASASQNMILLITDAYAKDWKVFPYTDSSQQNYDLMPADYVLRGIPLSPGFHHFRLQYAPSAFYLGRNISLISLILFLFLTTTVCFFRNILGGTTQFLCKSRKLKTIHRCIF